jgi:hypothetical protein
MGSSNWRVAPSIQNSKSKTQNQSKTHSFSREQRFHSHFKTRPDTCCFASIQNSKSKTPPDAFLFNSNPNPQNHLKLKTQNS